MICHIITSLFARSVYLLYLSHLNKIKDMMGLQLNVQIQEKICAIYGSEMLIKRLAKYLPELVK